MASTLIGKQAVVIGAGMAGLTAAGALSDRFDQVVVLERDTLPSEPAHSAGTPQARHVHGLLLSGQRALSELFPGFEQDLARAGAVPLRAGLDVRVERPGYDPFPQRDLGWSGYAASRPTIERAVRRRVESHGNTTLDQRCRVQEVLASPNGAIGHRRALRERATAPAKRLRRISLSMPPDAAPSLSLCCSRSAAHCPRRPPSASISCYATSIFAIPDGASSDWKGVMTFGEAPQNSRGGLMLPLEGDRWMADHWPGAR